MRVQGVARSVGELRAVGDGLGRRLGGAGGRPSSATVKQLWPGPYCLVVSLLVKTGVGDFDQFAGFMRSASASAVSKPMQ